MAGTLNRKELLARGGGLVAAAAFAPAFRFASSAAPRLNVLARTFRGQIITRTSALYPAVYAPYNANYASVHPLAVVRPVDAADVATVIRWAAAEHVAIVARSGGHSYGGYSTTPGVVVDLAHLSGVSVAGDRATLGPGARLGMVYTGLAAHNRAIPAGTCPSVGIGGHALGGGFGLATRAWGLAADNLVGVQVVTADGQVLNTDASHHSDLFWASRGGGGGNFGIATRMLFRTRPVSSGSYFVATYEWGQVEQVVAGFLAWAPHTNARLGSLCRLTTGTTPTVQVFGQFLGSANELKSLLAGLHPPATKLTVASSSWLDLVARWAGCLGHSLPGCSTASPNAFVASSSYIDKVPTASQLALFREAIEERGTQPGALLIDAYGGAVNAVVPTATAFPHRRSLASVQYYASGDVSARAWVTEARQQLAPAMTGEAYVNYLDPALPHPLSAYYGVNLPRLVQVKRKYDPHALFHFPQGIPTHL